MFGIDDAILIAGANLLGGIYSNNQNRQAAESAQQFSAQQYATRYQTQVADMKSAGLNPMLAYQQSPGSAPQGVSYQSQNPVAGVASAYQSVKAGQVSPSQIDLNKASAGQAAAGAELAQETARKTIQEVSNLKNSNEQTTAIIKNLGEEYQNLIKQGWNLTAVGNQLRASVKLMGDQSDQIGALMRLTDWDSKLREMQGSLAGYDVEAAKSLGNLGRSFKEAGPLLELLRSLLRR